MQATVPIALFGWLIVVIGLFVTLKPHRAVIASVLGGYLFLPKAKWTIASGIPDWSSDAAISWYTLACALAFAPKDILRFRPAWMDSFVALGLLGWGFSSILAGYGIKQAVLDWWFYLNWAVIPYFLARCYLTSTDRLRDLALGMLIALVVYAPLILFEVRFYPQLNRLVYGFQIDRGVHVARLDGYRPIVFMVRGLALGIWVAASVVVIWALYLSGKPRAWMNVPMGLISAGAVLVGLLTRSTGAIALMLGGVATLLAIRMIGRRWLALLLPLAVVIYLGTGVLGSSLPVREIGVKILQPFASAERLGSLTFRFDHEALLADRAREQLIFGFGGWGEYRDIDSATVREETGFKRIVTDGFWIITFGQRGLLGVATTFGWMLVPACAALLTLSCHRIPRSIVMLVAGFSLWSSILAADQLLNGFVNPVQGVVAGALASVTLWSQTGSAAARPTPPTHSQSTERRHNLSRARTVVQRI